MATDQEIRTALARARKAIELRPSLGQGSMKTRLRLEDGVKCVSHNEGWRFELDEPTAVGGEGTAPSPGVYGLSALAGCVAMSVKMQAVQAGLGVDGVNVEVEADYDDRGMFGIDGFAPGFKEFRVKIDVDTSAPEARVREITDQALGISGWFHVFSHAQRITTDVSVHSHAADGAES
jgi:uncharacterized OsmC-like protein